MGSQMNTHKKINRGAYIEGTAVRKLSQYEQAVPDEMPQRHYAPEKRQQAPQRKNSQSRPKTRQKALDRRRARARAFQMNMGYVGFLSIAAVACLFICVNYLKLQAQVTESRSCRTMQLILKQFLPWIWMRSAILPSMSLAWFTQTRIRSLLTTNRTKIMSVSTRKCRRNSIQVV